MPSASSASTRPRKLAHATDVIGPPDYSQPNIAIYRGDCLDFLRQLPNAIVDLTVTSPPYNIGKEYERPLSTAQYLDWCAEWIAEIHRVTAPTGAFWLNLGYFALPGRAKALPIPYMLWDRIPFFIMQEIVWHYGAGVAARKFFSPRNEKFLWCIKTEGCYTFNLDAVRDKNVKYPNQKKNGKLKCNPLGKNPTDVWKFAKVTSGKNRSSQERTPHPAQFPLAVVDRIVRACTGPGALVLDPFMGSGTTAEACLLTKRSCLGFELRDDYIQIAAQRLTSSARRSEASKAQLQLPFGK